MERAGPRSSGRREGAFDGPARDDLVPRVRRALASLGRAHDDRGPIEMQSLKSRGSRRASWFIGRCTASPFGMVVQWGLVLKRSSPERIAELHAVHVALHRALNGRLDLPAAPQIADARAEDGWIAIEAWPGLMMASNPPEPRARHAAHVARLLAALELSPDPRRQWPARRWSAEDELERLAKVWERASEPLPGWMPALAEALRRADGTFVPSHRDLNAEQVIVDPRAADTDASARRWIDWDLASRAPRGLDLGNLLAHERLAANAGQGIGTEFHELRVGVLAAYNDAGGQATRLELAAWEAIACLRLAGLALQRARGDDPVTRNPAWLPAPSHRRHEAVAMRRARREVFMAGRPTSR